MKTIINKSNFVIVVTNEFISKEIPINGQVILQDDEINGNYLFDIEFFSKKQMKTENNLEMVRTCGNRYGLWFERSTVIPMKTAVDLLECSEIIVKDEKIEFHFLTAIFKKISLIKPHVDNCNFAKKTLFVNDKDKKYFLRWLLIELIITVLLFPILIYCSVFSFIDGWGWFECILMCLTTLAFAYCYCRKLFYCVVYKKL